MEFHFDRCDQLALLRQAPEFAYAVEHFDLKSFEYSGDLFFALVQSIVSQQLSVHAAAAVFSRLEKFLGGSVDTESILKADPEAMRQCGLSCRKVEYLQGIARAAASGEIVFHELGQLSDDEIIKRLTCLRGVGIWTAEMLLIFALGRKDVLSFKDLGIRKGMRLLYKLDHDVTPDEFEVLRRKYSPYGTLASFYLWSYKDNIPVMKD